MRRLRRNPNDSRASEQDAIRRALAEHRDRQRAELSECVAVLQAEAATIRTGDVALLERQADVRRQCIRNVIAVQRAVDALEGRFQERYGPLDTELRKGRTMARELAARVADLLQANRDSMRQRTCAVEKELAGIRLPRAPRSPYGRNPAPSLLDIET